MKPVPIVLRWVLLLVVFGSVACINTVELPERPNHVPAALWKLPPIAHANAVRSFTPPTVEQLNRLTHFYKSFEAQFRPDSPEGRTVTGQNDYAAALIYLGRTYEAIRVLKIIEHDNRGTYATAANLGTACELAGDLEGARQWISEGIRRDPTDHLGTEWLHLAIIAAKEKVKVDPAWLLTHSVLELQPARNDDETVRAIAYQMNERLNFIAAEDATIADLFFQAGKRTSDPVVRGYFFDESRRFGDLRRDEIAQARRETAAP